MLRVGEDRIARFGSSDFYSIMSQIHIDHSEFTFIDIGSGKGKLLLLASKYPFKQIVGVEYAPLLHSIALKNCAVFKSSEQRCSRITPLLSDALEYKIPHGPIVCFIGNALDPPTMKLVLQNIVHELFSEPRPMYIIYASLRSVRESGGSLSILRGMRRIVSSSRYIIFASR